MSRDRIVLGFIPLVDAAIPIVAGDLGFAEAHGIELTLVREISWANVRDRLTLGHFHAAHLLAPVAIATTLGLGSMKAALATPMALGLNGDAITLSSSLDAELRPHIARDADAADPAVTGPAFAALVEERRRRGAEPPTLGMTFPFSTHNYHLRLWLGAAGLDPDEDVRLVVLPPPYMVDALASGHVDGFCVGAPWNSAAVEQGLGRIVHLGTDLVRRCPEKVLAVRTGWLDVNAALAQRLVRALVEAALWIEQPENRAELADLLARPDRVGAPAEVIRRTLDGRLPTGVGDDIRTSPDYLMFARSAATRPDPRHARWIHAQMTRWRQAPLDPLAADLAAAVYRPDLHDAATAGLPLHAEWSPADGLGLFTDLA